MHSRIYNFSAGPAMLPEPVLFQAQQELMNFRGTGMSILELSHRSDTFLEVLHTAKQDLRSLLSVPESYRILFLQGGGTQQFSMVPLNLACPGKADYLVSGYWSRKAFLDAQKLTDAGSTECLPGAEVPVREDAKYVYICENETIEGTVWPSLPDTGGIPLVADQSSMFLSKPCDIAKYGLIFAGVQKNVGPAGLAIVIIREDLIQKNGDLPAFLSYEVQDQANSLYHTPNCWSIYFCGLVFRHLLDRGGLDAAARRNEEKAALLYCYLDDSSLFRPLVQGPCRSVMNVTFTTGDDALDRKFVKEAEQAGLVGLAGHKSKGALRASLYNAMPLSGAEALVSFMSDFERKG